MTHPSGTIPARSLGNREACLALFSGMLANQGADVTRVRDPEGVVKAIAVYLAKLELPTELRLSEEPVPRYAALAARAKAHADLRRTLGFGRCRPLAGDRRRRGNRDFVFGLGRGQSDQPEFPSPRRIS